MQDTIAIGGAKCCKKSSLHEISKYKYIVHWLPMCYSLML